MLLLHSPASLVASARGDPILQGEAQRCLAAYVRSPAGRGHTNEWEACMAG